MGNLNEKIYENDRNMSCRLSHYILTVYHMTSDWQWQWFYSRSSTWQVTDMDFDLWLWTVSPVVPELIHCYGTDTLLWDGTPCPMDCGPHDPRVTKYGIISSVPKLIHCGGMGPPVLWTVDPVVPEWPNMDLFVLSQNWYVTSARLRLGRRAMHDVSWYGVCIESVQPMILSMVFSVLYSQNVSK